MTEKFSYPQIKALIKQFSGQENTITIPRIFIELTGDHISALHLSQVIYWSDRTQDPDGWFYKTDDDWKKELGISRYQIKRSSKILKRLGIETKIDCINRVPYTHYRVNHEIFIPALMALLTPDENSQMQETRKCENVTPANVTNLHSQMRESLIEHEITTKITTETTCEEQQTLPPTPPPIEEEKPNGKRDPNLDHPAVKLYREICHLTGSEYQRKLIAEAISDTKEDLEHWKKTLKDWMGNDWNPKSVQSMLDRYRKAQAVSSAPPLADKKELESIEMEIMYASIHPTDRGEWLRLVRSDNPDTRTKYIHRWRSGERDLKHAA